MVDSVRRVALDNSFQMGLQVRCHGLYTYLSRHPSTTRAQARGPEGTVVILFLDALSGIFSPPPRAAPQV